MTGPVTFDPYGDTTNRQFSVYTVQSGGWEFTTSDAYRP
ncbi:hypothetical protein AB0K51_17440 [Kitasatospora sp. NPDC049285]